MIVFNQLYLQYSNNKLDTKVKYFCNTFRKDPKQTNVQRMWINHENGKDDFWAAIRSNYDYIMDTNLIDTCKVRYAIKITCTHECNTKTI